jgi:hypothetical protein
MTPLPKNNFLKRSAQGLCSVALLAFGFATLDLTRRALSSEDSVGSLGHQLEPSLNTIALGCALAARRARNRPRSAPAPALGG